MGFFDYYNDYDEENRLHRNTTRKIEFITNVSLIEKYLSKSSKILDVGAGTGAYAFYFAQNGHQVEALDIVEKHVDEMKQKHSTSNEKYTINISQGNALNLSNYSDNTFDLVICFGPIYHLHSYEDRVKCLEECKRVLKPNGYLAIAYINKQFIIPRIVEQEKIMLTDENLIEFESTGNIVGRESSDFLSISHFDSPKDIENLALDIKLEKVVHAGSEGISLFIENELNSLNENDFNNWVKYHLKNCCDESILGISNHGIFIGKK